MNVCVVTPFRESSRYVPGYIDQALKLDYPAPQLRWVLVEGDSTDDTWQQLRAWAEADMRVTTIKCDTGKPYYQSVVHPERFEILSRVMNAGLDVALSQDWADYMWFMPCDVAYQPDILKRLMAWDKDLISPMFWIGPHTGDPVQNANGMRFYDIWGFVRNGQPFPPNGPAWYAAHLPQEPVEMDTTGGMMLLRSEVVKAGCRHTPAEVDHGLCKMARAAGFGVWCDPSTHIVHRER